MKHSFTATGQSAVVSISDMREAVSYADFDTGTGVGTVQLEMRVEDVWAPVQAAITATPSTLSIISAQLEQETELRWNCTVYTSGTIAVYII
jgi:hypothetical protein